MIVGRITGVRARIRGRHLPLMLGRRLKLFGLIGVPGIASSRTADISRGQVRPPQTRTRRTAGISIVICIPVV